MNICLMFTEDELLGNQKYLENKVFYHGEKVNYVSVLFYYYSQLVVYEF